MITVVVPCYPPHQKYIPDFLENMNKQTVKPDKIIIALSEVSDRDVKFFNDTWGVIASVDFQVVGQEEKCLAAANRNYGAMHVETEYILFLDADDEYSSNLIDTLKKYIDLDNPMAMIYHCTFDNFDDQSVLQLFYKKITSQELFNQCFPDKKKEEMYEMYNMRPQLSYEFVHHGHICIKRELWEECPQQDIGGREDSIYVRSILWKWYEEGCNGSGLIVLPEVLAKYKPNKEK